MFTTNSLYMDKLFILDRACTRVPNELTGSPRIRQQDGACMIRETPSIIDKRIEVVRAALNRSTIPARTSL
jgi:hypothetical protein